MPTGIYVKPNEQVTITVSGTQRLEPLLGHINMIKNGEKKLIFHLALIPSLHQTAAY